MEHVGQPSNLDLTGDAEIGPRSTGQLAEQLELDFDAATFDGRIDARDHGLDHRFVGVDGRDLPERELGRLRLGDPQLGRELARLDDLGHDRAWRHPLAFFQGDLAQHSGRACGHGQLADLLVAKLGDRGQPRDRGRLRFELRIA